MRQIAPSQARRIALGAQGFADPAPTGRVDARHLRRVLDRIGLIQLDSVNVVVRTHYMPLFSRLGPYPMEMIDDLAYRRKELVEYWAHAASLVPMRHYPLFRHRMVGRKPWRDLDEHPGYIEAVLEEVVRNGPLTVGQLEDGGERTGPWWGYGKGKLALEWLFAIGAVTVADRRNFTRYYDVPERVLPADVLAAPVPGRGEAQLELVRLAMRWLGIGTTDDVADYYRIGNKEAQLALDELIRLGEIEEVVVAGWGRPAYLDSASKVPRRIAARALLSPFDPVVWYRPRAERMFGFHYRIEIYVPKPKREFGYYVMPFLLGDDLVARVDLKADRQAAKLLVPGAFLEEGRDAKHVAREMAAELRSMAGWLGLGDVVVGRRGRLAAALRSALG